ncbi:membrane protein [Nocardia wallacei]|uniref:Membrane protein n=1 Tax=Nocardia wallacei TaxID=480035 RepID=A0A7G1KX36_9NOCA|nr:membrane protein [Nocardia wallacei]
MSETTQSDQLRGRRIGLPDEPPARHRRARIGVVVAATAVSVLAALLVLAAWRDDMLINSNKGVTSAEVLSAGRLRSAVTYVTPDGVTRNPKVGVLYPTKLTAGERINVEYSKQDPELVRVAGRDARVAIIPALSVIVVAWLLALPVLWLLRRSERRAPA